MSSGKLIDLRTLLLATSMLTVGAVGAARAQEGSETVIVTGSHIATPGFTAPTPVTSVSAADLEAKATTQINQLEYSIPQLVPNSGTQGTSPQGQSSLNLRGLGGLRTLMLLDGRRVSPTAYDGSTDANIIPTGLVKRVDVVTGGASAAYGSDALAGVVNFVLDNTYEGLKGSFQTGESQYHDSKDLDFSLTGGFSFDEGRGHIVVAGELFSNSGSSGSIKGTTGAARRPYARRGYALIPGGTGFPSQIVAPNVNFAAMTSGGLITSGPLKGIYFGPNAALQTMVYGTHVSATFMQGGTGETAVLYGSVSPQLGRESIYTHASYDLTSDLTVWGQLLIVHNTSFAPSVMNYDNNTLTIKNDNPFLPANIKTLMTASNVTQFTYGRFDPELGLGNSQGYIYDVLWDAGVSGKIGNWAWDLTAQFNSNAWDFKFGNERNNALWTLGIDVTSNPAVGGVPGVAVGAPICRSTIAAPSNGCVPINIIGVNSITPAMANYVGGTSNNYVPQQTWNVMGNLSGVLLQDWAGDVSMAAGFEIRRDSEHGYADSVSIAKQWRGFNLLPFTGNFQVEEGYVETDIPLLKNVPFAQELGLNLAGRLTNYSNFGMVETWKIGLNNQVNDDVRLRGIYSSDIRAPTLSDLYAAPGTTSGQFYNNNNKQTQTLSTPTMGNPNLLPEQANTFVVGVVYSPAWLAGFQGSLDYYRIHLHNGIQTTTAQQQVDNCQLYNIAASCALIVTNPTTGLLTSVTVSPINVANTQMDGIDTELSYSFPGNMIWDRLDGNFRLRAVSTYVNAITSTSAAGVTTNQVMQVTNSGAGVTGSIPKWAGIINASYSTEKWNFQLDYRYTGALRFNNAYVQGVNIDTNHVASRYYFNTTVEYQILDNWKVFARVANLFNVAPPVNPSSGNIVTTTSLSQTYERIGRQYYVGARFNF